MDAVKNSTFTVTSETLSNVTDNSLRLIGGTESFVNAVFDNVTVNAACKIDAFTVPDQWTGKNVKVIDSTGSLCDTRPDTSN